MKYNNNYCDWKSWDAESFGKLKATEEKYFSAEIRKSKTNFYCDTAVLEIGFGNGSFLKYCKQNSWKVVGIEANKQLVIEAKKNNYEAIHADNLLKIQSASFDLIVAFDVLEHIPLETLPGFLDSIRRVLKKNGIFIARFPNGDSPFGLQGQNGDPTHVTVIGSGKAKFLAMHAGLEVLSLEGSAQPIMGTSFHHFLHRIIANPILWVLNKVINLLIYPGLNVPFCAQNLTLVCRNNS